MLPSLSDKTKSFIAVCAVLAVAVGNVVFGMDWVAERPVARTRAAVTGVAEPPMVAVPPVPAASPAPPAAAVSPPLNGNTAAPPDRDAPHPNATAQTDEPAAPAPEAAPPKCDIAACAAAYRTFTATDCTYAPSFGVRRLCTKGTPPQ